MKRPNPSRASDSSGFSGAAESMEPASAVVLFCGFAGFCDLLTGILLILTPETVLAMLGLPMADEPIFLRYIGVFVANVGLAYLYPWWRRLPSQGARPGSPHGMGGRAEPSMVEVIEMLFELTAAVRLAVAAFVFASVLSGALHPAWAWVGLTDLALAVVQILWLRRGISAHSFPTPDPSSAQGARPR